MVHKENETLLFNSSLISQYNSTLIAPKHLDIYNVKIISCGSYIQVYKFKNIRSKVNKETNLNDTLKHSIKFADTDNLSKLSRVDSPKSIMLSNAIRSNLHCQRIAKSNRNSWETFITLTFSDNITDLRFANKIFSSWVSNIRKIKKDFKYLAVPEFQKRGAVHYHVLSNLGINDTKIIYKQKIKTGKAINFDTLYDVKYWVKGYARVDFIKNDYKKIYSYICKYMTKDIDNKLFGKHRYFNSQNLIKPKTEYLDLTKQEHLNYYNKLLHNKKIEYNSIYCDSYTHNEIEFLELL